MKLITWTILIAFGFLGVFINVIKKKAMNSFGETFGNISLSNVLRPETWFALMSNPLALFVLFMGFISWGIGMWLMQLEQMNTIVVALYGISIPFMLINIVAGMAIFGDSFTFEQWVGVGIVLVAGIISIPGVYLIGGGKLW